MRALNLLEVVWGYGECISAAQLEEVDAVALPGETPLCTLARVAGMPDLPAIPAFRSEIVLMQVRRARALMEIHQALVPKVG
jgi:hypothetical protein